MGLHDELRHLAGGGDGPVVRVERYEAVVLEAPDDDAGCCVCGRGWAGGRVPEDGFVAGDRPALGAGSGGVLMDVVAVMRSIEALGVRLVGWVLLKGARHPRLVLWAAVVWLVAAVVS